MADFDTSMRITADTKAAVENVGRLDGAFARISTQAGPRVGSMFGTLSQQAISMQGGIGGLSGGLSLLGSALYTLNPLLGMAGGAIAAVTVSMLQKKKATDETSNALLANVDVIVSLIEKNEALGLLERGRRTEQRALLEEQKKQLEEQIGLVRGQMFVTEGYFKVMTAGSAMLMISRKSDLEALNKELTVLESRLVGTQNNLRSLAEKPDKDQGNRIAKFADERLRLMQVGRDLSDRERAEREAGEKATSDRLMQLTVEAATFRVSTETQTAEQINAAYDTLHDSVIASYADKIAAAQGSADQEYVINWELNLKLSQLDDQRARGLKVFYDNQAKTAAKTAKLQLDMYSVVGSAFQRLIQGQTTMHGGFAAFFVDTIGDSAQAALKAYAALWAAEAAAYAISNPVLAASKARAAAMAGVAVGVVGALTEAAVSQITKEREQSVAQIGTFSTGAEAALGETVKGRTLVSQGPVTLNYSAILTINGGVYGIDDLFDQFQRWNMDQLRIAGVDVAQRARG